MFREIDFAMIDICNAQNFRDEKTISSRDIALTRPGKFERQTRPNHKFHLVLTFICSRHMHNIELVDEQYRQQDKFVSDLVRLALRTR